MQPLLKRDAMDCGPTCLAIVAQHYKVQVSRQKLRELCALGRDGSSLLGISKAAKALGFKILLSGKLQNSRKIGLMVKCTPIIVELPSVYRGCKPLICFQ